LVSVYTFTKCRFFTVCLFVCLPRTISERSDTESLAAESTPGRCQSPESMISANSGYMSMTGSANFYRLPERLRIVKPLEGRAQCFEEL